MSLQRMIGIVVVTALSPRTQTPTQACIADMCLTGTESYTVPFYNSINHQCSISSFVDCKVKSTSIHAKGKISNVVGSLFKVFNWSTRKYQRES